MLSLYIEKGKGNTKVEWRDVHRKDGTVFKQRKHVKVSTPIKMFDEIKERKKEISSNGYEINQVRKFVSDIVDNNFLEKLKSQIGDTNKYVFLALPSNTGRNIIPNVMVDHIGEKLGIDIIDHSHILQDEIHESKKLLGIDKLLKRTKYSFDNLDTKGKEIIIVDDLHTTGLGIKNLKDTLVEKGYKVSDLSVTLGQTGNSEISERMLIDIYDKIVEHYSDIDKNVIKSNVEKLRGISSTIGRQMLFYHLNKKKIPNSYREWFSKED